ncbi:cupin domain-containing protein [Candidatus Bipolaricaulota bacterium]|nr:cupin domain-containing protein [Candidatus Bipolaricaulota bacterium]MBS3791419.1 cupin domain-containing protein [Candidatus Bipolaricaulota bacterium]
MEVTDLKKLSPKKGAEVFYEAEEFSERLIELPPGGEMPSCEEDNYVSFYVISGKAVVSVDDEETDLQEGECLTTEPATMGMETEEGVRILGIQVEKG